MQKCYCSELTLVASRRPFNPLGAGKNMISGAFGQLVKYESFWSRFGEKYGNHNYWNPFFSISTRIQRRIYSMLICKISPLWIQHFQIPNIKIFALRALYVILRIQTLRATRHVKFNGVTGIYYNVNFPYYIVLPIRFLSSNLGQFWTVWWKVRKSYWGPLNSWWNVRKSYFFLLQGG